MPALTIELLKKKINKCSGQKVLFVLLDNIENMLHEKRIFASEKASDFNSVLKARGSIETYNTVIGIINKAVKIAEEG